MGKLFRLIGCTPEIRPRKFGPDFGPKTGFGFTAVLRVRPIGGVGGGKDRKFPR